MRTSLISLAAALSLSSSLACVEAPSAEALTSQEENLKAPGGVLGGPVVVFEPTPPTSKGLMLQGPMLQGMSQQGMSQQGMSQQGMSQQGEYILSFAMQGGAMGRVPVSFQVKRGELFAKPGKASVLGGPTQYSGKQLINARINAIYTSADGTQNVQFPVRIVDVARLEERICPNAPQLCDVGFLQQPQNGSWFTTTSERASTYLYKVEMGVPSHGGTQWIPMCEADPSSPAAIADYALVFSSTWDATASRKEVAGRFSFGCMKGAVSKCYRWGYVPWQNAERQSIHQACTRMARADYCGDGRSFTADGQTIDIYDTFDPRLHDLSGTPGFDAEAMWHENGAYCSFKERLGAAFNMPQDLCKDGPNDTSYPQMLTCTSILLAPNTLVVGNYSFPTPRRMDITPMKVR